MDTPEQQIAQIVDDFLILMITTDIDWETKPTPEIWSRKEILGHLIDSAIANLSRFVRCTYEQNFKLVYEQNAWVNAQHYQDSKIDDLLTMWRLMNKQISRVLKNYPTGLLQNTCDTGNGAVSVNFIANDYIEHMSNHLEQILK